MQQFARLGLLLIAIVGHLGLVHRSHANSPGKLTVIIDGLRHSQGDVCLRVFSSPDGFPMGDAGEAANGCIRISGPRASKQFNGLQQGGTYAVVAVDDQNGDRKLNRNILGIPTEGFGVSNNPSVSVQSGPPKFDDASFILDPNKTINIRMKYSLD